MSEERLQMHKAIQAGVTPFAMTTFRNKDRVFGIKVDDRRRHIYVIGKTGMGKTTLIENMVYSDIVAGHGVCYVDPHGDTAEKMLEWIPSNRINDVIYFNPADINFPISFNVLEKVAPEYRHLVSAGLIGVFKKQWADSWGPRLEYILRNAILGLLEYPDSTLLGINRILVDKVYRKKVVDKIQDPVVKSFWVDEYTKWNDRVLQEVISPIQNKVGQFLSTALIRNIVGQVKSSIDLRKVMDDGKILILNLSKGRIGEDASAMLGAMMVTKIQLAAMSRVDIKEDTRKDFYLYVDEFQNFATDSFADILSEARKYRLNLIIAHQYIEQLGEVVKPAVFGNVGTLICFRVGATDAEFLEQEFMPDLTQEDLVNLPKFNFYLKLMIDGVASEPFSAKGLPPVYSGSLGNEEKVIRASRERYAKPKEIVEDKIMRWSSGAKESLPAGKVREEMEKGITVDVFAKKQSYDREERPRQQSARPYAKSDQRDFVPNQAAGQAKYKALCNNCQTEIEVPFKPDNIRPIYCKECLKKSRRGEIQIKRPNFKEEAFEEKNIQPAVSLNVIKKQTVDFRGKPLTERKKEPNQVMPSTPPVIKPKPTNIEEIKSKQADESWKEEIAKPWEIAKPASPKSSQPPAKSLGRAEKRSVAPVKKESEIEVPQKKPQVNLLQSKKFESEIKDTSEDEAEEPVRHKPPSVDLLGSQGNDNEVKEGEVVEL